MSFGPLGPVLPPAPCHSVVSVVPFGAHLSFGPGETVLPLFTLASLQSSYSVGSLNSSLSGVTDRALHSQRTRQPLFTRSAFSSGVTRGPVVSW